MTKKLSAKLSEFLTRVRKNMISFIFLNIRFYILKIEKNLFEIIIKFILINDNVFIAILAFIHDMY